MGSGLEPSTTKTTDDTFAGSSSNGGTNNNNNNNVIGDFECNICFDLAQDPIIALCGHLFCWPCLYRWLHYHSKAQECPVCKALVQEHKLVPLYGRGKSTSDPRSRPISDFEVPKQPSRQRPDTVTPRISSHQRYIPDFGNFGFGLLGGLVLIPTARFGNITLSAGLGGLFPEMISFQFNGFPDSSVYGAAHGHGLQTGFPDSSVYDAAHGHGLQTEFPHLGHGHEAHNHSQVSTQRQDVLLRNLFVIIGFLVLLSFIFT